MKRKKGNFLSFRVSLFFLLFLSTYLAVCGSLVFFAKKVSASLSLSLHLRRIIWQSDLPHVRNSILLLLDLPLILQRVSISLYRRLLRAILTWERCSGDNVIVLQLFCPAFTFTCVNCPSTFTACKDEDTALEERRRRMHIITRVAHAKEAHVSSMCRDLSCSLVSFFQHKKCTQIGKWHPPPRRVSRWRRKRELPGIKWALSHLMIPVNYASITWASSTRDL